jgi:hypothetical protein
LKAVSGSSRLTAFLDRKENLHLPVFNHAQPAGMLKPLAALTKIGCPKSAAGYRIRSWLGAPVTIVHVAEVERKFRCTF